MKMTSGYNTSYLLLFFSGQATIQDMVVDKHNAAILDSRGDRVTISNRSSIGQKTRFLLLAGEPIREPVVQHGPFVMNTMEEIEKTFDDLRNGLNGFENAPRWRSKAGIRWGNEKTFNQEPPFPLYLMKDLVILYILYSDVIVLLDNLV